MAPQGENNGSAFMDFEVPGLDEDMLAEVKQAASDLALAVWRLFMEGVNNLDDAIEAALNEPSID